MTVRVSAAVMAVPERATRAAELSAQLFGCPIVVDPARRGCWWTAKRAWLAAAPDATHHLVVQDDAELCPDFPVAAVAALTARPGAPVMFFSRTKVADRATALGLSWCACRNGAWGVAACLPVPLLREFLAWEEVRVVPACPFDDLRISFWAVETGRLIFATVPALAQHAKGPSVLHGAKVPPRQCPYFAREGAAGVDWQAGATGDVPTNTSLGPMPAYARQWLHGGLRAARRA